MRRVFKYQEEMERISSNLHCPESAYINFGEKESFRFVFEDLAHPSSYLPPAKIKPARFIEKGDREHCEALGLSLFSTREAAIQRYKDLSASFKNFKKNIGTHLAIGSVDEHDGQITPEDEISHFNLFEYVDFKIEQKFQIVDEL